MNQTRSRFKPRRNLLCLCISAALAVPLAFPLAHAANAVAAKSVQQEFNIAGGELANALNALARQVGATLSVDSSLLRARHTEALSGTYSVEQALDRLLQGTGLVATFASNTIIISPAAITSNRDEGADSRTLSLPKVEVTGNDIPAYQSLTPPSVSRSSLTLQEIPRSVQTYTRELILDTQAAKIDDIITRSPNVVYMGSSDGRDNTFVMRGFQTSDLITDGFKYRESISDPEVFNLERIEVMKGADSVLYGASSAGGLISLTNKRPLHEQHGELVLKTNSDGAFNPKIDIGGPANQSGSTRYRLVAAYDKDPGWRDFTNDNERKFAAGSLAFDVSEKATLTLFAEYTDDDQQNDMGTAIDVNGQPITSLKTVNSHPDDTLVRDQTVVGLDFDYEFNAQWKANIKLRRLEGSFDYGNIWLPFGYADPYYIRVVANQSSEYTESALQANLYGDVQLAGLRHRISTGIDISDATSAFKGCFDPGSRDMLDFKNPVYAPQPGDACDTSLYPGAFAYSPGDKDKIKRRGVFVTDAISVTDKLIITGGLRYEDHTSESPSGGSYSSISDESTVLPQLGATYKLNEQASVYASYSESFTPATQRDRNGNLLDAEEGKGYEVGVKTSLLQGKLKLNAAAFTVTKENVAMPDPDPTFSALGLSVASGEQTSKGFELDVTGSVTPQLDLIASVGLLETEDKGTHPGKDLISAPKQTVSLWANYQVASNWKVGAGFQYVGSRFADQANDVRLDNYTLFNAAVTYQHKNWRAQLNLNNLTDEEYIESAWGGTARGVTPGEPANATLSVAYSF